MDRSTTASFQAMIPLLYPFDRSEIRIQSIVAMMAGRNNEQLPAQQVCVIEALLNQGNPDEVQDELLAWQMSALATRVAEAAVTADSFAVHETAGRFLASRQNLEGRVRASRTCIGHA
jgi:hypothetical protein